MTRKLIIAAIAFVGLTFGGLSAEAEAQCSYNQRVSGTCPSIVQPEGPVGPLTLNTSAAAAAANALGSVETAAADLSAAGGASNPDAQSSLAFTGAESAVLGYVGAGLIGLGSVAVVVARRKSDED